MAKSSSKRRYQDKISALQESANATQEDFDRIIGEVKTIWAPPVHVSTLAGGQAVTLTRHGSMPDLGILATAHPARRMDCGGGVMKTERTSRDTSPYSRYHCIAIDDNRYLVIKTHFPCPGPPGPHHQEHQHPKSFCKPEKSSSKYECCILLSLITTEILSVNPNITCLADELGCKCSMDRRIVQHSHVCFKPWIMDSLCPTRQSSSAGSVEHCQARVCEL